MMTTEALRDLVRNAGPEGGLASEERSCRAIATIVSRCDSRLPTGSGSSMNMYWSSGGLFARVH